MTIAAGSAERRSARAAALAALACLVGSAVSGGPVLIATFGLFLEPVTREFGWRHTTYAAVLTIVSVAATVAYPIVGRLTDRFGARVVGLIGTLGYGLSVTALGWMPASIVQVYLMFAIAGLFSAVPGTVLYTKIVSSWFVRARGVMLGATTGIGAAVGFTLLPQLAERLSEDHGWRGAYIGLGLLILIVSLPITLFGLREGASSDPAPSLARYPVAASHAVRDALRRPTFWALLVSVSIGAGALTGLLTHLVPMLGTMGVSTPDAVNLLSVDALASCLWQLVLGLLLDRSTSPRVAALAALAAAGGTALFGTAHTLGALYPAAALLGIGMGTDYALLPYCVSRYFGLRDYGAIFGLIFATVNLCTGTVPLLIALSLDMAGSYEPALIGITIALIGCGGLLASMPRWSTEAERTSRSGLQPVALES